MSFQRQKSRDVFSMSFRRTPTSLKGMNVSSRRRSPRKMSLVRSTPKGLYDPTSRRAWGKRCTTPSGSLMQLTRTYRPRSGSDRLRRLHPRLLMLFPFGEMKVCW